MGPKENQVQKNRRGKKMIAGRNYQDSRAAVAERLAGYPLRC